MGNQPPQRTESVNQNRQISEQDLQQPIEELMKALQETATHLDKIGEQFKALQTFDDL